MHPTRIIKLLATAFTCLISLTIHGQGSVGIGTTSPSSAFMLHVLGQTTKSGILVESSGNRFGMSISQTGSEAGLRVFNSTTSTAPEVRIEHQGSGDAFSISKTGVGGSAANFFNSNSANDGSVLFSATSAPNGYGVGAANFGNGNALAIWGGGIRVTQLTLSTGTTITSRAVAYLITGGGPYTFSFGLSVGELFYVFNATANPVLVNSIPIPAGAGRTLIVMDGVLRGF